MAHKIPETAKPALKALVMASIPSKSKAEKAKKSRTLMARLKSLARRGSPWAAAIAVAIVGGKQIHSHRNAIAAKLPVEWKTVAKQAANAIKTTSTTQWTAVKTMAAPHVAKGRVWAHKLLNPRRTAFGPEGFTFTNNEKGRTVKGVYEINHQLPNRGLKSSPRRTTYAPVSIRHPRYQFALDR